MSVRDLLNNFKATSAFDYASRTATTDGTNIIDMQGFRSLLFAIQLATVTTADADNTVTFTIIVGDASDLSDGVAATAATGLLGSNLVVNATSQSNKVGLMGYSGGKRYARLKATEVGTTSAAYSALALQGHGEIVPVGDQAFA